VLAALNDARIRAVPIRTGETAAELWAMFDAITGQVGSGETVIFDITHGLRSLPFLVFLFAAYLKSTRQVKIEAVYYGALELGSAERPAPVVDLSPFVGMLDWLTAANRFTQYGDSQDLAHLLRRAERGKDDKTLGAAADALDHLSLSLRLIRPADAMVDSARLPAVLEAARPAAEATPSARPYTFLAADLERAYAPFAQASPFEPAELQASLEKQRQLVAWYVDHAQWVQAVTLAREWLISWVMWHLGESSWLDRELRESVAETMGKEAARLRAA
jgi:CRISPR-associated DxTHG motif protein